MRALILAAGQGTRLRPYTDDRPKPMVEVGGRPLLEHGIDLLRRHGIREIAINLHYLPESITGFFGDGARHGVAITYSHEERLLGSAGAAKRLASFLQGDFVVLYGDVLTDVDVSQVIAAHRDQRADATLTLYEVEDPTRAGIVEVEPAGRVVRFVEKPPASLQLGNLANAGLCVLSSRVIERVPPERPYDLGSDLFPDLLQQGYRLFAQRFPGYFLDIGSPERLAQAQADIASGAFRPDFDTRGDAPAGASGR